MDVVAGAAQASAEEARLRAEAIFQKYPGRFSPSQQARIRAESERLQGSLDVLRRSPLDDGDVPATVFRPRPPARRP